jgi:hypothetical protein
MTQLFSLDGLPAKPIRIAWFVFGGVLALFALLHIGLAVLALRNVVAGASEVYPNQHLVLLANSLAGTFLVAGALTLWKVRSARIRGLTGYLLVAAGCMSAWSIVLSTG